MPNILAEIITIGDELLYGQTVDTNSAWLGKNFSEYGIQVSQIISISDTPTAIKKALSEALSHVDIVIITGGLGPTNDDLTKRTLADFFGVDLKRDESVVVELQNRFNSKGRSDLTASNLNQADLPENCIKIQNNNGTAPGMWFDVEGKIVVSMPGVPHEMKAMMQETVFHKIEEKLNLPNIQHSIIHTVGIPESILSEQYKTLKSDCQNILA